MTQDSWLSIQHRSYILRLLKACWVQDKLPLLKRGNQANSAWNGPHLLMIWPIGMAYNNPASREAGATRHGHVHFCFHFTFDDAGVVPDVKHMQMEMLCVSISVVISHLKLHWFCRTWNKHRKADTPSLQICGVRSIFDTMHFYWMWNEHENSTSSVRPTCQASDLPSSWVSVTGK